MALSVTRSRILRDYPNSPTTRRVTEEYDLSNGSSIKRTFVIPASEDLSIAKSARIQGLNKELTDAPPDQGVMVKAVHGAVFAYLRDQVANKPAAFAALIGVSQADLVAWSDSVLGQE